MLAFFKQFFKLEHVHNIKTRTYISYVGAYIVTEEYCTKCDYTKILKTEKNPCWEEMHKPKIEVSERMEKYLLGEDD